MTLPKDRGEHLVDVLIRLSQGDMSARAERTFALDVDDAIAYCVNLLAVEFDRLLQERERNVQLRALEEQRIALEATIEAMLDPVLLLDPSCVVIRANRAAAALFGASSSALIGTPLAALTSRDEAPFVASLAAQVAREGVRERETELEIGGARVALPVSASAYLDGAGDVRGIVVVIRDDRDLRAARAQLQMTDRLAAVGTIAAGVAHEINNPLAFVISNLEFLMEELDERHAAFGEAGAEIRAALAAAHRGSDRVRQIVQDLRTFSRGDRDSFHPVDVNQLIHTALAMLDNEIRHHARVVLALGDIPPVEANEARLGQVFLNLFHNAAHAIPAGRASENTIRVATALDAAGRVVITVEDTGQGIEPRHKDRIFDAFFTTKPQGVGTGLGLSICHQVVTRLGGTITVDSVVGRGTTFTVTLPPSQKPLPATEAAPAPTTAAPRRRILVIDDELEVGQSVRRLLRRYHDVDAVQRADVALELLATTSYDVILCDVMMPEVTGMEFFSRLSAERPELTRTVIFVSGGAFSPEAREFVRQQRRPTVDKPFEARVLRTLIDEVASGG